MLLVKLQLLLVKLPVKLPVKLLRREGTPWALLKGHEVHITMLASGMLAKLLLLLPLLQHREGCRVCTGDGWSSSSSSSSRARMRQTTGLYRRRRGERCCHSLVVTRTYAASRWLCVGCRNPSFLAFAATPLSRRSAPLRLGSGGGFGETWGSVTWSRCALQDAWALVGVRD